MDPRNIAICLAPTLLNLNMMKEAITITNLPLSNISNTRQHPLSTQNLTDTSNLPTRDPTQFINRQCNASLECLCLMIQNPQKIFQVPREALSKTQSKHFEYQTPAQMRDLVRSKTALNNYLNDRVEEILKVNLTKKKT
jgi:hypothetical protein